MCDSYTVSHFGLTATEKQIALSNFASATHSRIHTCLRGDYN